MRLPTLVRELKAFKETLVQAHTRLGHWEANEAALRGFREVQQRSRPDKRASNELHSLMNPRSRYTLYRTRSTASKNSLPFRTSGLTPPFPPSLASFSACTSIPRSRPSVSCHPRGPWSQSAQVRYLIVAGADEVEVVEEEGGAALREKPMFSNARGEETDQ